jgi:hypothetical protein
VEDAVSIDRACPDAAGAAQTCPGWPDAHGTAGDVDIVVILH